MKVTSLLYEIEISGKSRKDAYKKANIWIAKNVMNNKVDLQWKILRASDNSVKVELYSVIKLEDVFISKCNSCKSFHSKFYINQQFNCDKCNAKALVKTLEEKLKIITQYNKEQLNT